jgi:capsular exopolysaccharide synthesis family protein
VDAAEAPKKPAKPNLAVNLSLGLLLGLGFGIGAAFLLEYLDNTLKSAEDVERFLQVPALALIPSAQSLNSNGRGGNGRGVYGLGQGKAAKQELATAKKGPPHPAWFRIDSPGQHGTFTEAFRGLRTSVLLSTAERAPRTLLVTSARPGEGKTTISINLSISLAQLGPGVLLIDGDLRRPSVHRAFGLENEGGVVRYLTGGQDWRQVVMPSGLEGLDVIVSGPMPPNPAELLSSERMRQLIREATREYRCVIIDSPPLLNVADSRILATMVEGLILVVEGGGTPREVAQRAQAYVRNVGAAVIGVVLNNLDLRADGGYYAQYYRDDYYTTPQAEENGDGAHAAKAEKF